MEGNLARLFLFAAFLLKSDAECFVNQAFLATGLTTKERPAQCQGIGEEAGPTERSVGRWSEVPGDR